MHCYLSVWANFGFCDVVVVSQLFRFVWHCIRLPERITHTVCMCCHILSVTFFFFANFWRSHRYAIACIIEFDNGDGEKKSSQIRRRAYERNIEIEKQNNHFKWIKWIYAHKKCSVIGDLKVRDHSKKSLWIQQKVLLVCNIDLNRILSPNTRWSKLWSGLVPVFGMNNSLL